MEAFRESVDEDSDTLGVLGNFPSGTSIYLLVLWLPCLPQASRDKQRHSKHGYPFISLLFGPLAPCKRCPRYELNNLHFKSQHTVPESTTEGQAEGPLSD